jgi:hypothetical protein
MPLPRGLCSNLSCHCACVCWRCAKFVKHSSAAGTDLTHRQSQQVVCICSWRPAVPEHPQQCPCAVLVYVVDDDGTAWLAGPHVCLSRAVQQTSPSVQAARHTACMAAPSNAMASVKWRSTAANDHIHDSNC